jgi:hypothetical protein
MRKGRSDPAFPVVSRPRDLDWRASSADEARQQHHDEDDQEEEKQDLRNSRGSKRDPTKA